VADVSAITYDALRLAAEHVLAKVREGKKLGTEDVFILYLGTIVNELKDVRSEVARLEDKIDKTNQRIDETNRRIDEIAKSLSARIDETNRRIDEMVKSLSARIDETNKRIDELAKRIDALQTTLLEIQKLLIELAKNGHQ